MAHHNPVEQKKARAWAQHMIEGDVVIIDFETTGFNDAEIVQIGAVNQDGEILMNTLVKPTEPIPYQATKVHGITDAMVADAPPFKEIYVKLSVLLAGKTAIAFNADFEKKMIVSVCKRHSLPLIKPAQWDCAMKTYARFKGDWNPRKRSYTWHSLSNACLQQKVAVINAHNAIGDCLMTLKLIEAMAK